jgi:hypothetical protein
MSATKAPSEAVRHSTRDDHRWWGMADECRKIADLNGGFAPPQLTAITGWPRPRLCHGPHSADDGSGRKAGCSPRYGDALCTRCANRALYCEEIAKPKNENFPHRASTTSHRQTDPAIPLRGAVAAQVIQAPVRYIPKLSQFAGPISVGELSSHMSRLVRAVYKECDLFVAELMLSFLQKLYPRLRNTATKAST